MKYFRKTIQYFRYSLSFILNRSGRDYHVDPFYKIYIVGIVLLNYFRVKSFTDPLQQLLLMEEILTIPENIKGDVVECGCFNGSSTISLSIACSVTKRKLFVCDSFEGLPVPGDHEKYDVSDNDLLKYKQWEKGQFASEGGMDAVQKVVARYGKIECCEFIKGYFCESLQNIHADSIVMVFEDADLASSVQDCILHLWPKLQDACKFYSHEPWSANVVALFYDKTFWKNNLSSKPPGFFGSGCGIIKAGYYTNIGYAKKVIVKK
jgi:O-methyltransferase